MKKAILIFLGIVLLVVLGFFVYEQRNITSKEEKDVEGKKEVENLDETAKNLQRIVEESHVMDGMGKKTTELTFTKEALQSDKNRVFSTMVFAMYMREKDNTDIVSMEKINQMLQTYYNVDALSTKQEIQIHNCQENLETYFIYNASKEAYEIKKEDNNFACSPTGLDGGIEPQYTHIHAIEKKNDVYILTLTALYYAEGELYTDRNYQQPLEEIKNQVPFTEVDFDSTTMEKITKEYETNYSKYSQNAKKSVITFKKRNDGTFYITSFKEMH